MIISGSDKFIKWINSSNCDNITVSSKYNHVLQNGLLHSFLLVVEFNNHRFNYGVVYCKDRINSPLLISFGPTYESYDGEYRSIIMIYDDLQKKYDDAMHLFHYLERLIQRMINNKVINLTTLSMTDYVADITDYVADITIYNIMILALVINLNASIILNNLYDNNIDPVFVDLIKYIYDYDSSILVNPYIIIEDQICSKVIPIENISDFKYYDFNEIEINQKINSLVVNKVTNVFPIFIDWAFIKPITKNFFNNNLLKISMSDEFNLSNYIISPIDFSSEQPKDKHVETYMATIFLNKYVGNTLRSISKFYKKCPLDVCHMFELMYGLYVLHKKCNVIHGDITLNNITFTNRSKSDNNVNVYILSELGEYDTYVFNDDNLKCHIIDFSRSIVSTKFFKDEIKGYLYCEYQHPKVVTLLKKYTSTVFNNIDDIFSTLCLIDYIELSNCLTLLLKNTKLEQLNDKLNKLSNELFIKNINSLDRSNPLDNGLKDIELLLFKELFSSNLFESDDTHFQIKCVFYNI